MQPCPNLTKSEILHENDNIIFRYGKGYLSCMGHLSILIWIKIHVDNNQNMFDVVEFCNFAIFDKKISFKDLIV